MSGDANGVAEICTVGGEWDGMDNTGVVISGQVKGVGWLFNVVKVNGIGIGGEGEEELLGGVNGEGFGGVVGFDCMETFPIIGCG